MWPTQVVFNIANLQYSCNEIRIISAGHIFMQLLFSAVVWMFLLALFSSWNVWKECRVCPAHGETHQGHATVVNWFLLCAGTMDPAYYYIRIPLNKWLLSVLTIRLCSICLYRSDLVVSLPLLSPESSGGSELVKFLLILVLYSSTSRIWL